MSSNFRLKVFPLMSFPFKCRSTYVLDFKFNHFSDNLKSDNSKRFINIRLYIRDLNQGIYDIFDVQSVGSFESLFCFQFNLYDIHYKSFKFILKFFNELIICTATFNIGLNLLKLRHLWHVVYTTTFLLFRCWSIS